MDTRLLRPLKEILKTAKLPCGHDRIRLVRPGKMGKAAVDGDARKGRDLPELLKALTLHPHADPVHAGLHGDVDMGGAVKGLRLLGEPLRLPKGGNGHRKAAADGPSVFFSLKGPQHQDRGRYPFSPEQSAFLLRGYGIGVRITGKGSEKSLDSVAVGISLYHCTELRSLRKDPPDGLQIGSEGLQIDSCKDPPVGQILLIDKNAHWVSSFPSATATAVT